MVKKEVERQKEFNRQKAEMERKRTELARKMKAEKPPQMNVQHEKKETAQETLRKMEDAARYVTKMAEKAARESFLMYYWNNGEPQIDKKTGRWVPNPEYKEEKYKKATVALDRSIETALKYGYQVLNEGANEEQREEVGSLLKALVEGDRPNEGHGIIVKAGSVTKNSTNEVYQLIDIAMKQGKGSMKFGEEIKDNEGKYMGTVFAMGNYEYVTSPVSPYTGKGTVSPIDSLRQWADAYSVSKK
jgi:hypothetical protein